MGRFLCVQCSGAHGDASFKKRHTDAPRASPHEDKSTTPGGPSWDFGGNIHLNVLL